MKTLIKYLKPYTLSILFVFLLVAIRAFLDLLLPKYMSLMLAEGLGLSDKVSEPNMQRIIEISIIMISFTVASIIVTIISSYYESRISSKFALELRRAVYQKIESFSLNEVDHFTTSSLITRTTNDIQQVQGYVNMMLRMIILQPVFAIGAITMAILENASLSVILVASVLSLMGMIVVIFMITLPKFKVIQMLVDKLNLVTRENLSGLRVVRAYNTEEVQAKRIDDASLESRKINVFVSRVMSLMWPVMGLIMGLTSLAIVYISTKHINFIEGSAYEPTQMMALVQYGMRTIMSFMMLTMMFMMIPRASISAKRIAEVLNMPVPIKDSDDPVNVDNQAIKGVIRFDNVTFKYPDADAPVLKNISFVANENETTAFIGSTGSGKSTLINLVPRFYEVTEGSITIDDINIKDFRLHDLHELMGYVPQKGVLFSGTIFENIAFGEHTDASYVKTASEIAQAKGFIEGFNEQYDTQIAQGGTNVSGGQRQRLSIARAIAKKPKIMIFDDSFSALDYKTDQNLRKALKENLSVTTLVVAQRINTIKHADQIIVLDQGEIVGKGTHETLMKTCSVYQEVAYSQLSKEELS